jgi:hypothetical protein
MPAVYGSATINAQTSKGNLVLAQDMIGTSTALRANAGGEMQNGHIGAAEHQTVTPPARAAQIAADGTPCIDSNAAPLTWSVATGVWS